LDGPFRLWYDLGEYVIEDFTDSETDEILQRQVLKGTQVSSEGDYFEGELDGPVFYYTKNGELEKTATYREGKLISTD
jgi:antitoxin component YwqK of YwqJK toxin-antitoxin module